MKQSLQMIPGKYADSTAKALVLAKAHIAEHGHGVLIVNQKQKESFFYPHKEMLTNNTNLAENAPEKDFVRNMITAVNDCDFSKETMTFTIAEGGNYFQKIKE